ncbi:hypothetical protein B0T25DRAFT_356330 [Lasiosphaeria hispida]|uniref:DUF8212 domain-containing protein n=1 Tax=Lasiosphaeria hispida TaxID=260671 RepID=A0AAJ0M8S1_9PEZI|nr:hypothetical protein B0T25DRAFT_356330 [Lasiosphaeria hispida]
MCWAAGRVTKRKEDITYCLLGIFGVYMPMIYGEGDRAFRRLQEQIMKDIGDDSILAWCLDLKGLAHDNSSTTIAGGALAASPSVFANCGQVASRARPPSGSFDVHGGSLQLYLSLYGSNWREAGPTQLRTSGRYEKSCRNPAHHYIRYAIWRVHKAEWPPCSPSCKARTRGFRAC